MFGVTMSMRGCCGIIDYGEKVAVAGFGGATLSWTTVATSWRILMGE